MKLYFFSVETSLKSFMILLLISLFVLVYVFYSFCQAMQNLKYACSDGADPLIIDGKIALLRKGLLFYREQLKKAVAAFQKVSQEDDNGNICTDLEENGDECEFDEDIEDVYSVSDEEDDGADVDSVGGDEADPVSSKITVPLRQHTLNTVCMWDFPNDVSQSSFQGRNGSNACSIIALLIAKGVHQVNCDLHPSASLSPVWVTLVYGCIKVGNALYDRWRASLPQRYLSAAEAVMVAGDRVNVSIGKRLLVRVRDPHPPSTLSYNLLQLCNDQSIRYALFIANEKTVLFIGMQNERLSLSTATNMVKTARRLFLARLPTWGTLLRPFRRPLDYIVTHMEI